MIPESSDYRCPGCVDCVRRRSALDCMPEIGEDGQCASRVGSCVVCGVEELSNAKCHGCGAFHCAEHLRGGLCEECRESQSLTSSLHVEGALRKAG